MAREVAPDRRKRVYKSPEARRADILNAARDVFNTIGFSDAKIVDITDAADIGKGTFYQYFETKDHVLAALWAEYVDAFIVTTQAMLAAEEDQWTTVDRLLTSLIDHAVENAELHRLVYGSGNAKALELCRDSNTQVVDLICAFIVRGASDGAFRSRNPDWTFRMIYHAAHGLLGDLIARNQSVDAGEVTRSVLELAHRTLGDPAA